MELLISFCIIAAFGLLGYVIWDTKSELARIKKRVSPILKMDDELARLRRKIEKTRRQGAEDIQKIKKEATTLKQKYDLALPRLRQLESEIARIEEDLEHTNIGLYKAHFTFEDSEAYKDAIQQLRDTRKDMVKSGRATKCNADWAVGDSKKEGAKMVKQTEKLFLRAFNAQGESAVASVTWRNYETMTGRIDKAFDAINKLGTVLQVSLLDELRQSWLDELKLVFEEKEKKQEEKEKAREERERVKEESRAIKELEREIKEAQIEEEIDKRALEQAKSQLSVVWGEEKDMLDGRIKELESHLSEALARKERALSMAQQTRVGHVYIISNEGAFGKGVVKIGLTRRVEPLDRIKELGDASVPFPFDVHALIFSEDAPALEARLHQSFADRRLNWVNKRKEFFRAEIIEVQKRIKELGLADELSVVVEAREYNETLAAIRLHLEKGGTASAIIGPSNTKRLPDDPFE